MIDPAEGRIVHSDSDGAAVGILNIDGVGQDEAEEGLLQGVVLMASIGRARPSGSGHGLGAVPNSNSQ